MKDFEELLKMTERPQDYSDEEIREMMNDPEMRAYYELMVDAEAGFALKRSDTSKVAKRPTRYTISHRFMKAAAIFAGVLLLSGISFAAYHFTLGWFFCRTRQGIPNPGSASVECSSTGGY